MVQRLVDVMARDLGVPRRRRDDAEGRALSVRTTFTALRFWMQALCIDDGYGGAIGITPTLVEWKALDWIGRVGAAYPWLVDTFTSVFVHRYCSALVAVGDLVETDEGTLRCTTPHNLTVRVADGASVTAQLGLRDPSAPQQRRRGCVLSGAIVFSDVIERDNVVRFDVDAIDPRMPGRDDLLFLSRWPGA